MARWKQKTIPLLGFLLAAGTYGLLSAFPHLFPVQRTRIALDMEASGGNNVELYLNDPREPIKQRIQPHKRQVYVFEGITNNLSFIRIDPTDLHGVDVALYSLVIEDSGGVLRRFEAADLNRWQSRGVALARMADLAFHFTAADDDPILYTKTDIALRPFGNRRWAWFVTKLPTPDFLPILIVGSFVLYAFVGLFDPQRRTHLALVLGAVLVLDLIVGRTAADDYSLPAAKAAVGHANFFGHSVAGNQLALLFSLAAALTLSLVLWLVEKLATKTRAGQMANAAEEEISFINVPREPWVPMVIGLAGVVSFPNLRTILADIQKATFTPQWDSNNLMYWSYLTHEGYQPYRDFWYPYSGFYIFSLPAPAGIILRWLYIWALLSIFSVSFCRLCGNRKGLTVFATFVMLAGLNSGLFGNSWRYLLSVDIAFSFLVADARSPARIRNYGAFWLSCALAWFFEPVQVLYAGMGIAAKMGLDWWLSKKLTASSWRTKIKWGLSVPLCAVIPTMLWMGWHGQLTEFLNSQLHLGDVAVYAALPTDLVGGLKDHLSRDFIAVALGPVLIALGFSDRLRHRNLQKPQSDAVFVLGVTAFMASQKHIIRDISADMMTFAVVGLLAYVLLRPETRTFLDLLCVSVVCGSVLFLLAQTGSAKEILINLWSWPRTISDTVHVIGREPGLIEKANAAEYSRERFASFTEEQELTEWILRHATNTAYKVFSLTDNPALYVLTGEAPVYYSNLYNASPLYEQKKLADWLIHRKPQYVVLDPQIAEFDEVPNYVRCPIVFETVIENYVPDRVIGRNEILRRIQPGEGIPFEYWRAKLGSEVNLGHLARVSSFARSQPCNPEESSCADFLEIRFVTKHPLRQAVSIPIEAGGMSFSLRIETVPFEDAYYVLLDRLWFWKLAKEHQKAVSISEQTAPENVKLRIHHRRELSENLY